MFLWDVYRVSPGITQPGYFSSCGPAAHLLTRPGGRPRLATPPAHDYRSLNSGNDLLSTLSTTVYSVLQRLTKDFGRTNTVSISGCLTGYVTRQAVIYRFHKRLPKAVAYRFHKRLPKAVTYCFR